MNTQTRIIALLVAAIALAVSIPLFVKKHRDARFDGIWTQVGPNIALIAPFVGPTVGGERGLPIKANYHMPLDYTCDAAGCVSYQREVTQDGQTGADTKFSDLLDDIQTQEKINRHDTAGIDRPDVPRVVPSSFVKVPPDELREWYIGRKGSLILIGRPIILRWRRNFTGVKTGEKKIRQSYIISSGPLYVIRTWTFYGEHVAPTLQKFAPKHAEK